MNEPITSAAELDALPDETLIGKRFVPDGPLAIYRRGELGYWVSWSGMRRYRSDELADWTPLTVLYRPDQPQHVQPSANAIGDAIKDAHTGVYGPDEWWLDAAVAAVLALFAQQPTVAEIARKAWARGYSDAMGDYEHSDPLPPNPYGESEVHHG